MEQDSDGDLGSRAITLWQVEIFRYVLPHLLAGCMAGVVASVAMVATNLGSLRNLVLTTEGGWLAFLLLTFGMVVTFGSVAIGAAIMGLDWDET
ncbi:MAG: hypothetical protein U1E70_10065 [Acetobacteraceae bacterium]|nr:hypothetical protein [Pseudomonadota bacterium]